MLPVVFAALTSGTFGQKKYKLLNMDGSVGFYGVNRSADVKLIQSLLNVVPGTQGGPSPKLTVDGSVGTKTINAIRGYQSRHLAFNDGRVDVGGRTILHLAKVAGAVGLPPALAGVTDPPTALANVLQSLAPLDADSCFMGKPPTFDSGWDFAGSTAINIGISVFGGVSGTIKIQNRSSPPVVKTITFGGIGASLSAAPVAVEWATKDMPSFGTKLYRTPAAGPSFSAPSGFAGPCLLLSIAATTPNIGGPGVSGTLIAFLTNFGIVKGIAAMVGKCWGSPNAGITVAAGGCTVS